MSTIDAISADMRAAGCSPWVVDDITKSLSHQDPKLQLTFRLRTNGYTESEIANAMGKGKATISRYVHTLRACLLSLYDPAWS